MNNSQFNNGLMKFLQSCPTPFHTAEYMADILNKAGFIRLFEADLWKLKKGNQYYVIRDDSSIIAFTLGKKNLYETGIRMTGAHTDSPCLRVKPLPEIRRYSYLQLGVEVYGGALLNTWFDRDLSLAGRIVYITDTDEIKTQLIDFQKPVAVVPSLAIHFDREANKNKTINPQDEIVPVLMQTSDNDNIEFRDILLAQLKQQYPDSRAVYVSDYEISCYDTQAPLFTGLNQEFITGPRLDNLCSCYSNLMSLLKADKSCSCLMVCNNHEEVGSSSYSGAQGPFLQSVLKRLCPEPENYARTIEQSIMISNDDAHGIHPNYTSKYDLNHSPVLNYGPVIKINSSQRYASDSKTCAMFRQMCYKLSVPVQDFVMRSDMPCGSTIGPLTATRIGIKVVDIGIPIFAMHSIRETAGSIDGFYLYQVLCRYYQGF